MELFYLIGNLITGIVTVIVCIWLFTELFKKKQYDYYILTMYGLVDPHLLGPFEFNECEEKLEAYREDPEQSQNSFTVIKVSKGAEIDV